MKKLFLITLCLFTLTAFAQKFNGGNYTLYKGGPTINFVSDGQQWSPDECGTSKLQIICRSNAFLHAYECDNGNISMVEKVWKVSCNSENKNITFWGECIANTGNTYSTTVYEVRQHRSTYWRRNCDVCSNFSFNDCSNGTSRLGNFTVSVVEPVRFENIDGIRNLCKYANVVNLRNYLNDKIRGTIYLDGQVVSDGLLNPANVSGGIHEIWVKQQYSNGWWESKHETINIIIPPAVNAGKDFAICADYGQFFLSGEPSGGTWSGTGVTNGTFNTKAENIVPGFYDLTYQKTDQYGCVASAKIKAQVNALPTVTNSIQTTFCNKDVAVDLTKITPKDGVWKGQGISGNIFSPEGAGVGDWTITLEVINSTTKCSNIENKVVKVKPNPEVYTGTPLQVCAGAPAIEINGDSPLGGIYTGDGINFTNNKYVFNPKDLTASTFTLTYTVTENGCATKKTRSAIVNPKPTLSLINNNLTVCPEQSQLQLNNVTPIGGFYSGAFVTGSIFNVKTAGSGTHSVNYSFTDANSCTNSTSFTVSIIEKVVIDAGPDFEACENDPILKLSGYFPEGGLWSGSGIGGNQFDPGTAGVGSYILKYIVDYGTGCQGFDTRTVKVKEKPTVFGGGLLSVCEKSNPIKLNTGLPTGGFWQGTGVEADFFNPRLVSSGSMQLKYIYKAENGCSNTATRNVVVNEVPVVSAGNNFYNCVNGSTIAMSGVPQDAIWSGKGINGNLFNPANAGPGQHTLYLKKTNNFGCVGLDSTIAIVNALPVVNAGEDLSICKNIEQVNLIGTPSGGIWIGEGIDGNTFLPSGISTAQVILKYSYTDQNQCTGTDSKKITVLPVPTVSIDSENKVCENSPTLTLKGGLPAGGKWDGKGVLNNLFYPTLTGSGAQFVSYTYKDANNCSVSTTAFVNVVPAPNVNAGNDTVMCKTSDYMDMATYKTNVMGGIWSGGGITNNIMNPSGLAAGRYSLIYKYTDQSTKCTNEDSISVEIQQGLDMPTITGNTILCQGDTVNIEANVEGEDIDTKYKWYKQGETASFIEGKRVNFIHSQSITIFTEAVTPLKKCPSVRGKIDLINDTPVGVITATKSSVAKEDALKFTFSGAGSVYNWDFGDGNSSIEKNPYHYYYTPGTYTISVEVTSSNNCKAKFENKNLIKVTGTDIVIITETEEDENYAILNDLYLNGYPNPVIDQFNVEASEESNYDVTIYDMTGTILINKVFRGKKDIVDFSALPAGYYLLKVKSERINKTFKIEKF